MDGPVPGRRFWPQSWPAPTRALDDVERERWQLPFLPETGLEGEQDGRDGCRFCRNLRVGGRHEKTRLPILPEKGMVGVDEASGAEGERGGKEVERGRHRHTHGGIRNGEEERIGDDESRTSIPYGAGERKRS